MKAILKEDILSNGKKENFPVSKNLIELIEE
jgi:hypothetical protein